MTDADEPEFDYEAWERRMVALAREKRFGLPREHTLACRGPSPEATPSTTPSTRETSVDSSRYPASTQLKEEQDALSAAANRKGEAGSKDLLAMLFSMSGTATKKRRLE